MTNGHEKYLELAKKLKALAERGEGGEKYNAQQQLNRIMQKYEITEAMLEEQTLRKIHFRCQKINRQILIQIILSVTDNERYLAGSRRTPTFITAEVTKLEEAEIRAKYNFYSRDFKDQFKLFTLAYIQKNRLFPDDVTLADPEAMSAKDRERTEKMLAIARSITRAQYRHQLK